MWNGLHPNHLHKVASLNIIDHILSTPDILQRYQEPYKLNFRKTPSFADVMEDLKSHTIFLNCMTGDRSNIDLLTFLQGWEAMRDNADPTEYSPYAAVDVVSQPGKGLSHCVSEVPEQLQRDDVVIREEGGSDRLSSLVTPGGSTTVPRVDGYGSGQVLCVTYGVKLLLFWDWSEELMLFLDNHATEIERAAKTLEGMSWSILTPGEYLLLSPGEVYAAMSPINSVMTGWTFVLPQWLMEGTIEKLMTWELNDIEKRIIDGSSTHAERVKQIEIELKMWNAWRSKRGLSQEMKNELQQLKKKIEARVNKLKKNLGKAK